MVVYATSAQTFIIYKHTQKKGIITLLGEVCSLHNKTAVPLSYMDKLRPLVKGTPKMNFLILNIFIMSKVSEAGATAQKKVAIKVTFNGKTLINDQMSQDELASELNNSFKDLMQAVNLVTKVSNRKGLTHVLQIDDKKTTFKGGKLGASMVSALVAHQIETNGGARVNTYRETVKNQVKSLPISARTVEAISVFDDYMNGNVSGIALTAALQIEAPKTATAAQKAEKAAKIIKTAL